MHARPTRALRALALTAALTLSVAACGDDDGGSARQLSSTEHNEADVAFASDMLQHHAQALAMVDLTRERPLDPEVQQLTEQIRDAQAPEIELFSDWLVEWGEDIPPTVRDHVNAGHGSDGDAGSAEAPDHGDMPGMMTAEEMETLESSPDADFQDLWLEMMVEHHEGAVEMARTQQEEGRFRPAVELAERIAESQTAEIELMQDLLGS